MKRTGKSKISMMKVATIYTICNLVVKGLAFITTPIFARLMTKGEFGDFNNMSSWITIIMVVTTADLYASINTAKYDYKGKIDEFLSSILLLSNIITLMCYGIVELYMGFFTRFFGMETIYIRFMFIYLLLSPAVSFLQTKNRIYNEYKSVVFLTIITVIVSVSASLLLIYVMNDALLARMLGNYVVVSVIDIFVWIYVIWKGKCFRWEYCKYALKLSIPLIPHNLAGNLLVSSDRIIVKKLCGAEDAAIYSLAYTIAMLASILLTSLNQAWIPWLYDRISEEKYIEVQERTKYYVGVFSWMCIGAILVSPEIVTLFGGKAYYEARFVIAPVIIGIMLQFLYTLYVNIEFYLKKTFMISVMTIIAAGINILLNYLLIPHFGYRAAAYTTIIGYAFMVVGHYLIVRLYNKYVDVYDKKAILYMLILMVGLLPLSFLICKYILVRYFSWIVYAVLSGYIMMRYRKDIVSLLKKEKK